MHQVIEKEYHRYKVHFRGQRAMSQQMKQSRRPRKQRLGKTTGKTLSLEITRPLSEAQILYANRNYNDSIRQLSTVIKLAPRLADPYLVLGRIYEDFQDYLKAIQFYSLAALYTPKSFELSKKIAFLCADNGQPNQSLAYCYKALKMIPNDIELLVLRIQMKLELEDFHSSDTYLNLLISTFPEMYYIYIDYSERCEQLGYTDMAINHFVKYIQTVFKNHNFRMVDNDLGFNKDAEAVSNINTNSNSNSEVNGGIINDPNTNVNASATTVDNATEVSRQRLTILDIEKSVQELSSCFYACRRAVDLLLDKKTKALTSLSIASKRIHNVETGSSSSSSSSNINNEFATKGYILIRNCVEYMQQLKSYVECDMALQPPPNNENNNSNGRSVNQYFEDLIVPLDIHILEIICMIRQKNTDYHEKEGFLLLKPIIFGFINRFQKNSNRANALITDTTTVTTGTEVMSINDEMLIDDDYFELQVFFIHQLIRIAEDYYDTGRVTLSTKSISTAVLSLEHIVLVFHTYIERQQQQQQQQQNQSDLVMNTTTLS